MEEIVKKKIYVLLAMWILFTYGLGIYAFGYGIYHTWYSYIFSGLLLIITSYTSSILLVLCLIFVKLKTLKEEL